jgi:chromosome segregation protein
VKRQIGSLQRQAGKAKRYKQISLELQHLETQLARHQFDVLQRRFPRKIPPLKNCGTKSNKARTTFCVLKMKSRNCANGFRIWNTKSPRMQQRGLELKGEIDRHESRIQFNEERLRELASQNSKALAEITQAEERCRAAQEELAGRDRKIVRVRNRARAAQGLRWKRRR